MKRKAKGFGSTLGFEKLEGRRLLAADFAAGVMGAVDFEPAQMCQVAPAEYAESAEVVDSALTEALGENAGEVSAELPTDTPISATDLDQTDQSIQAEIEALKPDPRNLDLTDSMDGYFGTISPDSPSETLTFTADADGMANVVVSSTFGDAEIQLTANSSDGTLIEMQAESDGGFSLLSFDVAQGETYELNVCSTDAQSEGQFQLTVGFEAFVDQHADLVGTDSTELTWADNQAELNGKLESPGDIDTFKVIAPATGEVTFELNEMVANDRIDLDVQVLDADGNLIADGGTNEMLRISFDVIESEQFFIAVSAGDGQKGDYQFEMNLDAATSLDLVEGTATDVTTEDVAGEDATPEVVITEDVLTEDVTGEVVTTEVDGELLAKESCDDTPIVEVIGTTDQAVGVEAELVESDAELIADATVEESSIAVVDEPDQPIVDQTIGFAECPVEVENPNGVELSDQADLAQADSVEPPTEVLDEVCNEEVALVEPTSNDTSIAVLPPADVIPVNLDEEMDSKNDGQDANLINPTTEFDFNLVAQDTTAVLPIEVENDMEIVCTFGADSVDLFFAEVGNEDGFGFEPESLRGQRFASRFGGFGRRF